MQPPGSYSRALLKISGEALSPKDGKGLSEDRIEYVAAEIKDGRQVCPELAVVIGGGNIVRGAKLRPRGPARLRADYAGMAATLVNALVLQDALERLELPCRLYSAVPFGDLAGAFTSETCRADLESGRVVILAGGTGSPLFTTDTAAALRGVQLGAEVVLKATRVAGVYSDDPHQCKDATLFSRLSYQDVLARALGVMDLCAISLCMDHALPVRVFDYSVSGNIRRALQGEAVGTLIGCEKDVNR